MGQYKKESGTTRVGDLLRSLKDAGAPILQAAGSLTGQPWLNAIGNAINKGNELKQEEKQMAFELLLQDYADLAKAREMNIAIQNDEHSSWISKNLPYFFDAFILLIWGGITIYVIGNWIGLIETNINVDFTGILGIYAGLTSLATMVLQFHRGSSQGSRDKFKDIMKKQLY